MAQEKEERQAGRPVTFRLPPPVHADLVAIARLRGTDLAGLLNHVVSNAYPELMRWKAEHERGLAAAAAISEGGRPALLDALEAVEGPHDGEEGDSRRGAAAEYLVRVLDGLFRSGRAEDLVNALERFAARLEGVAGRVKMLTHYGWARVEKAKAGEDGGPQPASPFGAAALIEAAWPTKGGDPQPGETAADDAPPGTCASCPSAAVCENPTETLARVVPELEASRKQLLALRVESKAARQRAREDLDKAEEALLVNERALRRTEEAIRVTEKALRERTEGGGPRADDPPPAEPQETGEDPGKAPRRRGNRPAEAA
jgi:hypothetical protein